MGTCQFVVDRSVALFNGDKLVAGTVALSSSYAAANGGDHFDISNHFGDAAHARFGVLLSSWNGWHLEANMAAGPASGKIRAYMSVGNTVGLAFSSEAAEGLDLSAVNSTFFISGRP